MFSPISIGAMLPPQSLQLLLLAAILPSFIVNAASAYVTRQSTKYLRAVAAVEKAEFDLRAIKRDPNLTGNFVHTSKAERNVIALEKARDDLVASREKKAAAVKKLLTPFEMTCYACIVAWYWNAHILTITSAVHDAAKAGSYYKSLVFPASTFLHMVPSFTAKELGEFKGLGGSVGVVAVIYTARKCISRLFDVVKW